MTRLLSIASCGLMLAGAGCGTGGNPAAPGGNSGASPTGGSEETDGKAAGSSSSSTAGSGATGGAGSQTASSGTGNLLGASGASTGGASTGGASAGGASGSGKAGSSGSAGSGGGATLVTLPPLVTSAPGAYWKTDGALVDSTAAADVTLNLAATAQKWDGFGAAFNEQGWNVLSSSEMQSQAMKLLFSASEGAAFAWGRIPIGANDYALSRYTLDDTGSDVTPDETESNRPVADLTLSMFSLARDGQKLIPYVKAAQAVKPDLRFWASPWTPPLWMKTGFRKSDGWAVVPKPSYYDGGSIRGDLGTLAAYALYFTKFVQGYQAQGINIELVAPQEEPSFEQSYPSCVWDKVTYTMFIGQFLGPAMKALGVNVMLGLLSDGAKDFEYGSAALADNAARSFLPVIGAQWGALQETKLAALSTSLPVWATEHKGGNYPWNPSGFPPYQDYAPNDHAYGVESWTAIREAINELRVTSYNAWNMVLDRAGWSIDTSRQWAQNALLVADSGTLTATPAYYVFRHLSQYAAPGARVVGTTGGDAIAFKNPDGSLVVVMFNSGAANDHYVVAIGDKKLAFAMPSRGWATVKYGP